MGAAIRYDKYRLTTMEAWNVRRAKAELRYGFHYPWLFTSMTCFIHCFRAYLWKCILDMNNFLHYHLLVLSVILCCWAIIRTLPCAIKYKSKYRGCLNLSNNAWYWRGSLTLITGLSFYQFIASMIIFIGIDEVPTDPNLNYDEPSVAAMVLLTIFVTMQSILYFYQVLQMACNDCVVLPAYASSFGGKEPACKRSFI